MIGLSVALSVPTAVPDASPVVVALLDRTIEEIVWFVDCEAVIVFA